MITLYRVDNSKNSNVKGYWKDKDKIYIDNIEIIKTKTRQEIERAFKTGEQAVLYLVGNRAIIESKTGEKTTLTKRLLIKEKTVSKKKIRELVNQYEGLTLHKTKTGYTIEIWRA